MLPVGGTFTFEGNHVLGVTLVLFVELIFLGTIQELPDSNTIDCDYAAASVLVENSIYVLPLMLCWAHQLRIHPMSFSSLRPGGVFLIPTTRECEGLRS